jgi:exodeoxyribonuclease-3
LKEVGDIEWYKYIWHVWKRPWYAGTAIFYRENLKVVDMNNYFEKIEDFHTDWRITEIKFNNFRLINWYFPNWGTRADWTEMLWDKLEFYNKMIDYCNKIVTWGENVILTWDLNIAHTEIDIARPKENENSIWFLPVERKKITELLNNWYIDTFRYFYKNEINVYSWWSYRAWARIRNVWWRLDYFIVNNNFINKVKDVKYLTKVEWSDHCPVLLELK